MSVPSGNDPLRLRGERCPGTGKEISSREPSTAAPLTPWSIGVAVTSSWAGRRGHGGVRLGRLHAAATHAAPGIAPDPNQDPRQGDGPASGAGTAGGDSRGFRRPTQSLATPHEREHQRSFAAILPQGNGPFGILATNLDPGGGGTE
jgi:hypothetical protein